MMTMQEIDIMKNMDISQIDTELMELTEIQIDESLPKQERILDFIKKIRNPYCFKCNGVIIKLEFSNEGLSFEDGMVQYLIHKMGAASS